jgi:hypothetical protein
MGVTSVAGFRWTDGSVPQRARLRLEVGRLRTVFRKLAYVSARKRGFALSPRRTREVVSSGAARGRETCGGARLPRRR